MTVLPTYIAIPFPTDLYSSPSSLVLQLIISSFVFGLVISECLDWSQNWRQDPGSPRLGHGWSGTHRSGCRVVDVVLDENRQTRKDETWRKKKPRKERNSLTVTYKNWVPGGHTLLWSLIMFTYEGNQRLSDTHRQCPGVCPRRPTYGCPTVHT